MAGGMAYSQKQAASYDRNACYPAAQSAYSVASSHNPFSDSHTPSYNTPQTHTGSQYNHSSSSSLHQPSSYAAPQRYNYSQTPPGENRAGLGTPFMRERFAASGTFAPATLRNPTQYNTGLADAHSQLKTSSMQNLTNEAFSIERSRAGDLTKQRGKATDWTDTGREPDSEKSNAWKKWLLIGGIILLTAGGVGGGIAGWKISQSKSSSTSSSSSSGVDVSGDPTKFVKDPRLHKSMWGIAYAPKGTMIDVGCNATLDSVIGEIQLLSQLTTRIRTYGTDCNSSWLVMEAITRTKVDMTVWLGAYIDMANSTTTQRQLSDTLAVVEQYKGKNIGGVSIGNEVLLNAQQSSASYDFVTQNVNLMKQAIAKLNLGVSIPVGTSDAGSAFTQQFLTGMDFALANVHPWFAGTTIDDAAGWTWDFFQNNDVNIAGPNTKMYIGEVGWPSQAMAGSSNTYQGAVATTANLQKFLDTYVCQANANQTSYFYFEAFDEPWKERYKGVEPYWGLFDRNYKLKDITIPNCPPS